MTTHAWIVRRRFGWLLTAGIAIVFATGVSAAPLVLQSDFGVKDAAVASMKGVSMSVSPDLVIHDLTHEIPAYNIWEAAHRNGLRRVVYASSIHAVGMYPKTRAIGTEVPHRPDTYYGLAKCFAEDLASLYWDKRGLESVCLRILSCAQVGNARAVGSWLSYGDLVQLVTRAIDTPVTGFSVVYGVSDNDRAPVDNSGARFLGYRPRDNAEQFAQAVFAEAPPSDPLDPGQMCHGGPFASVELGHSGVAGMNIKDDRKRN